MGRALRDNDNQKRLVIPAHKESPTAADRLGEAALWMWRMTKPTSVKKRHGLRDVTESKLRQPVDWMSRRGITTGTTPTTFSPNQPVTRAQLITFLHRYKNQPQVTINTTIPTCDSFTSVSAGWGHSCGVRTDGTITCWGYNGNSQADVGLASVS